MSQSDAISIVRQWAAQQLYPLHSNCSHGVLVDERTPPFPAHLDFRDNRQGWWMFYFGEDDVLDGGGTVVFVQDATGEVEYWPPRTTE